MNIKNIMYGNKTYNSIASKDVGIVWGNLALDENIKQIKFEMRGSRFLRWSIKNSEWVNKMGGITQISNSISNNHLITNDAEILSLIKEIKEGDFIQIEGYLVDASWDNAILRTSTTRTDKSDGACEVIYVKKINWLK